jgi:hypothetical protein
MSKMPAGTEIRVRTVGIRRPISTALPPCWRNQRIASSTSSGAMVSQRPCRAAFRSSRSQPTHRPT